MQRLTHSACFASFTHSIDTGKHCTMDHSHTRTLFRHRNSSTQRWVKSSVDANYHFLINIFFPEPHRSRPKPIVNYKIHWSLWQAICHNGCNKSLALVHFCFHSKHVICFSMPLRSIVIVHCNAYWKPHPISIQLIQRRRSRLVWINANEPYPGKTFWSKPNTSFRYTSSSLSLFASNFH